MAATLSAYGSNVADRCRQPHGTVFKKKIIQVSKTIKITYSSFASSVTYQIIIDLLLSEIPFRIVAVEIKGSQAWGTVAE